MLLAVMWQAQDVTTEVCCGQWYMLTVLDLLACRAKAQGLRAMSSESLNV